MGGGRFDTSRSLGLIFYCKTNTMKQRKFTFDDQMAFAELSGDYNPLHIDPIEARRLFLGRQVVHGIHAFLWALNNLLEGYSIPLELRGVKVVFRNAIGLEETVSHSIKRQDKNRTEIELVTDDGVAARIYIDWSHKRPKRFEFLSTEYLEQGKSRVLSIEEAAAASGNVGLYIKLEAAAFLFPNLVRVLSPIQLAEILATTRLVGMECPGLHSMFSELNLTFGTETQGPPLLAYKVESCDRRFSLLSIKVEGPGMEGTVKAFIRPPPLNQASFVDLQEHVDAGEFVGVRALIIGGSRGLGEVTAKLLAAGGAEVKITYYQGAKDAQRVVDEIVSGGGWAEHLHFNVLNSPEVLTTKLGTQWKPNFLCYFATPFIFVGAKGKFSSQLFQKFCDYYISGFLNTVLTVRNQGAELKKIFYPSSISIDELPLNMAEYSAAKMAGEVLCNFFEKSNPDLTILKPRLPRLATDQTSTIFSVNNQDPIPLILDNLRDLQDK